MAEIETVFEEKFVPLIQSSKLFSAGKHSFEMYRRVGSLIMAYSFTDRNGHLAMMPMAGTLL